MLVVGATVRVSVGTVLVVGATLLVDGTMVRGRRWCLLWTSLVAEWVLLHWLLWQGDWTMMTAGKSRHGQLRCKKNCALLKCFGGALNIFTFDKLWVVHLMGKWMKYILSEEHSGTQKKQCSLEGYTSGKVYIWRERVGECVGGENDRFHEGQHENDRCNFWVSFNSRLTVTVGRLLFSCVVYIVVRNK